MYCKLIKIFSFCLIVFILFACTQKIQIETKQEPIEVINKEEKVIIKKEIKQIEDKAKEKKISPNKRLEALLVFLETSLYRVTVIDTEQNKIIYSQEFQLNNSDDFTNIEKVSNDFILIKNTKNQQYFSYSLIQPDSGEIHELKCPENTKITNINEKFYTCKILNNNNSSSEKEFLLPEFQETIIKKQVQEQKQIKEIASWKAELSPFDEKNNQTFLGERSLLKIFKDNKLIYEKNFSGKCTGCKLINQDNFKEAFSLTSIKDDKVLLTQILKEENNENLYTSILIIPSKNKLIHLQCNELEGEIAIVDEITDKDYQCKFSNSKKTNIKLPLPQ